MSGCVVLTNAGHGLLIAGRNSRRLEQTQRLDLNWLDPFQDESGIEGRLHRVICDPRNVVRREGCAAVLGLWIPTLTHPASSARTQEKQKTFQVHVNPIASLQSYTLRMLRCCVMEGNMEGAEFQSHQRGDIVVPAKQNQILRTQPLPDPEWTSHRLPQTVLHRSPSPRTELGPTANPVSLTYVHDLILLPRLLEALSHRSTTRISTPPMNFPNLGAK